MQSLPRSQRLRGRDLMAQLFAEGSKGTAGPILVRALPNSCGQTSIAAVAGKKLGNAVKRSRMKRRLRAAYRLQKQTLPAGWDLALVARRGLMEAKWPDVMQSVRKATERAIADHIGRRPSRPRPSTPGDGQSLGLPLG